MYRIVRFLQGYLQPGLMAKRLIKSDLDGLLDRHWIMVSSRKLTTFENIGSKVPDDKDLSVVFTRVYEAHHSGEEDPIIYQLSDEAGLEFERKYNDIENQIHEIQLDNITEEQTVRVLSKTAGSILRLAMILQACENAIVIGSNSTSRNVSKEVLLQAIDLIDHFNQQKLLLLESDEKPAANKQPNKQLDITYSSDPFDGEADSEFLASRKEQLKKLVEGEDEIKSRTFQQSKQFPPSPAKQGKRPEYTSRRAMGFLVRAAEVGLGEIESGVTKRSLVFRKRKIADIAEEVRKQLFPENTTDDQH